ncbi:MAG: histidine--tRNA ligase [Verrucomicrobiae bacterium]|nr:histidine--tRNA ligase [Verrucomicrobiae bacterium]
MKALPGFRDFYPPSLAVRQYLFETWRRQATRYGFREYDGPPLEPLELYTLKSGQEIVRQLYNFTDKGDRAVALRPEMTPTLARMVAAAHREYKKPLKWFAIPQLFRYEKQQRGRLREHFQFNADIIGESDIGADAELVALAIDTLCALGLTRQDFVVRLSDRRAWARQLERLGVAPEQHPAVLDAVDKMEREPLEKTQEKLAAITSRGAEVLEFAQRGQPGEELAELLARLGTLAEFCRVDYRIVRGLAYYTGIVWEIHDARGELRAIAGGGRYDNLIALVGGVDLPALGFGMGDVVLTELLKERGLLPAYRPQLDVYVVIADESLRGAAWGLIHGLRQAGCAVDYALAPAKVSKQFQQASALGARYAVVVGATEWQAGEVTLKNMETGAEERVAASAIATRIS